MILETLGAITILTGLYNIYKIQNYELVELKNKWKDIMEALEGEPYNNIKTQTFRITNTIKKEYGYDFIVNIPVKYSYKNLEDKLQLLENALGCDIKMNWNKKDSSAYLRLYKKQPEGIDLIQYKWNKVMKQKNLITLFNETYKLTNLIVQKKYGYDCEIEIPDGLSQSQLKDNQEFLDNAFGYVYIDYKSFTNKLSTKIVTEPLPDNYKFEPVKTKPYQFYVGTTHYYSNVVVNMSVDPHILLSGSTNSGKSILLKMAIANQIYQHTEEEIEFYFIETAEKTNDFDDFLKCKQVKAFAYNYNYAYKTLNYINNQIKTRSKIFSKYKTKNIYEYNKKIKNCTLPFINLVIEEIPSLMPDTEKTDLDYIIKTKCIRLLNTIVSQGRFAGIYIIGTVQRSDKESIKPTIKSNLNTRIALKQNNEASSLVVIDCGDAVSLPPREAIVLTSGNYTKIKTPYIDDKVIYNLIKNSIDKKHKLMTFNNSYQGTEAIPPINNVTDITKKMNKSKGDVCIDGLFDEKGRINL